VTGENPLGFIFQCWRIYCAEIKLNTFFILLISARARCGPGFTLRGQRVEASQLLKGQSENFKGVVVP
jgi:hypothetical protein